MTKAKQHRAVEKKAKVAAVKHTKTRTAVPGVPRKTGLVRKHTLRGVSSARLRGIAHKYGIWSVSTDANNALRAVVFGYAKRVLAKALDMHKPSHTVTRGDIEYAICADHRQRHPEPILTGM